MTASGDYSMAVELCAAGVFAFVFLLVGYKARSLRLVMCGALIAAAAIYFAVRS